MKTVTSDALETIDKALGITGAATPGSTEFEDKILQQTVDVNPYARRGRTLSNTTGLFSAMLRNVHTVDEVITTTVNPYALLAGTNRAPYPERVNEMQFDVWLIAAVCEFISGSGTIAAVLRYQPNGANLAWGVDDSGNTLTGATDFTLAFWDTFQTIGGFTFALQEQGGPTAFPGIRIRPGTRLIFVSDSSAALTVQCNLILGTYPVSLGQDVKV